MLTNRKSKFVLILITIFISVTVITSCNNSDNPSGKSLDSEMSRINSSDEITLRFYFSGNVDNKVNELRKMLDEVEKRSMQFLNDKLDFNWIRYDEYENKIKEFINAGDNFDAFSVNNGVQDFVERDLILDLSKLFPQYAREYYTKFSKDELNQLSVKGKLFAIPCYLPRSKRMCAVVRQDLMEKYKISDLKNYEDYENYLKMVKENERMVTPGSILPSDYTDDIFAESYGYYNVSKYLVAKWDEPQINIIPWEQVPEYQEAVDTMNRWFKNEYIKISDLQTIQNDAYNGRIASYLCLWQSSSESAINSNLKYIYRVYPLYIERISAKQPNFAIGIALNKNSKNPGRVIEFIEWLQSSQENYDLFMFGIKDENYVMKGENIDFTSNTKPISKWSGSYNFFNIDYIRPDINQPANYNEIYIKSEKLNVKYTPTSIILKDIKYTNEIEKRFLPFESLLKERVDKIDKIEKNLAVDDVNMLITDFISSQKKLGINNYTDEFSKMVKENATNEK